MNSAVLVIDVQQGLCEGDGAAFEAARTIDRINQVTTKARAAARPVIFIQHESNDGALVHASAGWQLAQGLEALATDLRVRKTAADSFHRTTLHEVLQHHGVTELVVCGMHTEFCVDTTTRRALALGYPVTLVEDAHTSAGNEVLSAPQVIAHHNITLSNIESFGPRVRLAAAADLRLGGC